LYRRRPKGQYFRRIQFTVKTRGGGERRVVLNPDQEKVRKYFDELREIWLKSKRRRSLA